MQVTVVPVVLDGDFGLRGDQDKLRYSNFTSKALQITYEDHSLHCKILLANR